MPRHISVIAIIVIAAFIILSFSTSFGGQTDRIPQVLPVAGSKESNAATDLKVNEPGSKPPTTPGSKGSGSGSGSGGSKSDLIGISSDILSGGAIAPKLENATAKAELGRATWKLFHTMMARFPDDPSPDDSLALKTYIQLFARLYPCGDCARHFQKLLAQYPPQTSSRNAAAGWACFVHNQVNERLKKPMFNCNDIGDFYDCGCGEDDAKKGPGGADGELKLEKDALSEEK
ncbi:ERV/ALR sulfhydryl oxidase domain-containing protein [Biscogniauxia mediterranea]|nr:ERV/ALR sulfhydryl oxidase domain-containing protein [Biscogniauxia mediterranea]